MVWVQGINKRSITSVTSLPTKCQCSTLKKNTPSMRNHSSSLGTVLSPEVSSIKGCLETKFLGPRT